MFTALIITLLLLTLNLPFLMWSNRKRKYGIYPGWISILTFIVLLGYYSSVIIFNSETERPTVKSFTKGDKGVLEYNKSIAKYAENNFKSEQKIAHYLSFVPYLFLATKIQCFIALILSIYGLLIVNNRNQFYWTLIFVYTGVLPALFLAEWYGSLR